MVYYLRSALLCAGLLLSVFINYSANLVFDLGGVLVDTSTYEAISQIGIFDLIRYAKNPRGLFFSYFDSVVPRTIQNYIPLDEHGNQLPQIMCDWLSGAKTSRELLDIVNESLEKNKTLSDVEKRIVSRFSQMIFLNAEFIKTKRVSTGGWRFIKRCKKKGHKVFILSNWDDSWSLMKQMHADFFNLFDGIIISAEVNMLKPNPAIYRLLLEKYKLNPADTVMIDDQAINLKAAQEVGMHAIFCQRKRKVITTKPDFKKVAQDFEFWQNLRLCSLQMRSV